MDGYLGIVVVPNGECSDSNASPFKCMDSARLWYWYNQNAVGHGVTSMQAADDHDLNALINLHMYGTIHELQVPVDG